MHTHKKYINNTKQKTNINNKSYKKQQANKQANNTNIQNIKTNISNQINQ